jgi:hypothetical protein
MQDELLTTVVPVTLVAIQSIAEDVLKGTPFGKQRVSDSIESLVKSGKIGRDLASEAHHWRLVRNVIAHAQGVIDQKTVKDLADLKRDGLVTFDRFKVWGPLISDGDGCPPVPLVARAFSSPRPPDASLPEIEVTLGAQLTVGACDLLAAGEVWAALMDAAV